VRGKRVYREHALQIAVAHMLQIVLDPTRTWWTAIDHGVGKLGVVEAGIRKRRGVKRGLPDFMLMAYATWPTLIGIELKSDKGELSEDQLDVADAWDDMGFPIYLARCQEDVNAILEHCKFPMSHRLQFFTEGKVHACARRLAKARHQRTSRRRKPKNHLPLVLGNPPQEN